MHAVRQDNPNAGRRRKVADDSMALATRITESEMSELTGAPRGERG